MAQNMLQVADYLRYRVKAWLLEDDQRTQRELAAAAGISGAHVSDFLHNKRPGIGWKAAEGLGRAVGMEMPALLSAAAEHAKTTPPAPTRPRAEKNSLGSHRQWVIILEQARDQHPDIPLEFFEEAAGWAIPGGPPEYLDLVFVAGIARELRDRAVRQKAAEARRTVSQSGEVDVGRSPKRARSKG